MWILKGENFTERNPKQKRHPFSHASQVFARFENPFFSNWLRYMSCWCWHTFPTFGLLLNQDFRSPKLKVKDLIWVLLKRPLPTPKTNPPVLKTKPAEKTEQNTRNLRRFFFLVGPFFFFRQKGFRWDLFSTLGPWPRGSPKWLVDSSWGWHLWRLPCFLLHGVWRGFLSENDLKKTHLARNLKTKPVGCGGEYRGTGFLGGVGWLAIPLFEPVFGGRGSG